MTDLSEYQKAVPIIMIDRKWSYHQLRIAIADVFKCIDNGAEIM